MLCGGCVWLRPCCVRCFVLSVLRCLAWAEGDEDVRCEIVLARRMAWCADAASTRVCRSVRSHKSEGNRSHVSQQSGGNKSQASKEAKSEAAAADHDGDHDAAAADHDHEDEAEAEKPVMHVGVECT
eukprot:2778287-Rhodomonas_salina.1